MDKMFARFEGRKSLKKNDYVDVHDDDGKCGNDRGNIDYVNVDSDGEEFFCSEQLDEEEILHENRGSMHESSDNLHDSSDNIVDEDEPISIPCLNQKFANLQRAENLFRAYALNHGFAIKIQNTQRRVNDKSIYGRMYVCNLAGENRGKNPVEEEEILIGSVGSVKGKRRRDVLPRSGCKVRMYVVNKKKSTHWEITSLELEHNHEVVTPSKMSLIRRERHVTAAQRNLIKTLHASGVPPRQQMNIFGQMHGGAEQVGFNSQHLRNVVRDFRKDNMGVNDAQAGLDLLYRLKEESGGKFFIKTLLDDEQRLKCLVWVDPRSMMAYRNFGDVVAFDTTYRTNRYAMPFVPFTGVNHHYQSIVFGFALVRDELKTTFEWVLSTWLEAIEGKEPLAIITDQDQAMAAAIESQLPNTSHLLCSWHISNKFPEKLATYYSKEGFKFDFNNCIYHSLTEVVFEDRWKALILKYNLEGNTWLQGLYALKHKWVEAYTRNTFSAGQKTTSRSEGMNAYFDAYVGSCTGLKDFVEGAQKALERQFMREKDEDYNTYHRSRCMQMKTALEHHAASIYTKEMFRRFQEQLVEANKYFVEKDRDRSLEDVEDTFYKCYRPLTGASQRTMYLVSFNKVSLRGSCICRMYDHVGMPCRHIIAVLTKRCVAELPEHFVKRRWTKDANRVDGVLPYQTSEVESPSHELTPTERFNHMTLLTMAFSHSCSASKERYEYAVGVINRETEIIEKMPVDGVEREGGEFNTQTTQGSGEKLHENILDPLVSKTKGRKKEHRHKSPLEELTKAKRKCRYCTMLGHDPV
nr:PREDICTED: protein FAR1-RELATED SEQUENCE 5-like [Daucus carota subsp. sativus]